MNNITEIVNEHFAGFWLKCYLTATTKAITNLPVKAHCVRGFLQEGQKKQK